MSTSFTQNNNVNVIITSPSTVTTRTDGTPLLIGDSWVDTNACSIKKWSGSTWNSTQSYTANFSTTTNRTNASVASLILDTQTFPTGLQFSVPAPTAVIQVLQTGLYLCSYAVNITNTSASVGSFSTNLRRITPSIQDRQEQRINIPASQIEQLCDTFLIFLTAGETYDLRMSGTTTYDSKNTNLVFNKVD